MALRKLTSWPVGCALMKMLIVCPQNAKHCSTLTIHLHRQMLCLIGFHCAIQCRPYCRRHHLLLTPMRTPMVTPMGTPMVGHNNGLKTNLNAIDLTIKLFNVKSKLFKLKWTRCITHYWYNFLCVCKWNGCIIFPTWILFCVWKIFCNFQIHKFRCCYIQSKTTVHLHLKWISSDSSV